MGSRSFNQFTLNTSPLCGDYLVGYSADGSKEIKTTVQDFLNIFFNYQTLFYNTLNQNLTLSKTNTISLSSLNQPYSSSTYTTICANSANWNTKSLNFYSNLVYDLSLNDIGNTVLIDEIGNSFVRIPSDSVTNFPIGSKITISRYGTGTVQISAMSNVVLRSSFFKSFLITQYSVANLIKIFNDEWVLYGDITD